MQQSSARRLSSQTILLFLWSSFLSVCVTGSLEMFFYFTYSGDLKSLNYLKYALIWAQASVSVCVCYKLALTLLFFLNPTKTTKILVKHPFSKVITKNSGWFVKFCFVVYARHQNNIKIWNETCRILTNY